MSDTPFKLWHSTSKMRILTDEEENVREYDKKLKSLFLPFWLLLHYDCIKPLSDEEFEDHQYFVMIFNMIPIVNNDIFLEALKIMSLEEKKEIAGKYNLNLEKYVSDNR